MVNNNEKIQREKKGKPIVYACSGCSNLAQIAHNISLSLDRDGIAEMSCIAGVVGNVTSFVMLANSGRPIIAIDGCDLSCTKSCLGITNLHADFYYQISDLGFDKRSKWDDSLADNAIAMQSIYQQLFNEGIGFDNS